MNQPWLQNFDPLSNAWLSTLAATIPVCTLFYFLAVRRSPAWRAAIYAFVATVVVALAVFRMPGVMVARAVADGLVFGRFRIAWVVVAAVFVYDISVESGQFAIVKQSIGDISEDRRRRCC
jgi:lactate permease